MHVAVAINISRLFISPPMPNENISLLFWGVRSDDVNFYFARTFIFYSMTHTGQKITEVSNCRKECRWWSALNSRTTLCIISRERLARSNLLPARERRLRPSAVLHQYATLFWPYTLILVTAPSIVVLGCHIGTLYILFTPWNGDNM